MLTSLCVHDVKNCDAVDLPLGAVTLFAGPNESGKTGMLESLRLALTGQAEIGAKNALQALIVSDSSAAASVHGELDGKPFEGTWQLTSKQSKDGVVKNSVLHSLVCGGITQHVDTITAGLPVTSKDFWQLTGEDKWSAIERVVGRFELPPPPGTAELKKQIESLMNRQPPEPYSGEPIHSLRDRTRSLSEWVDEQKNLRLHLAYRQAKLTEGQQRLVQQQAKLESEVSKSHLAEEHLAKVKDFATEATPLVNQWSESAEYRLDSGGDCLADALVDYVNTIKHNGEYLHELTDDYPEIKARLDSILVDVGLLDSQLVARESELKAVSLVPESAHLLREKLKASGIDVCVQRADTITTPVTAERFLDSVIDSAEREYRKSLTQVELYQGEIQSLKDATSQEDLSQKSCASDDSILAKAQELTSLQALLSTAEQWQRWIESSQQRLEEIEKLKVELKLAEQAGADWQRQRSAYMQDNLSAVTTIANSILSDVGCQPISLSVETTGKRNTLSLTAGGTDIKAMADSQQVIYGAALLHSLQMLSPSPCPVLFIKAGEISGNRLGRFLDSLVRHRTKGNVFAEHWYQPEFTNALVVNL